MVENDIFEKIKKHDENKKPYRSARELCKVLGYSEYRYFLPVVEKAKIACKKSYQKVSEHFELVHDMIKIGKGAKRQVDDIHLSRYACYLIIQNADPSKEIIALGQTYFTIQTRKQEVKQQHIEDQKRIQLRGEMSEHNKKLFKTARAAGVKDYGSFYDAGYVGLYGMRKHQIMEKKKLKDKDTILDYMDSEELAANLFRATQAESKIKREHIYGEDKANKAHFDVGKKIRKTIKELGGTMPEKIPAAENIKFARKRLTELEKNISLPEQQTTKTTYQIPETIQEIEIISHVIKTNPGSEIIHIGEKYFKVSSTGKVILKKLLVQQ